MKTDIDDEGGDKLHVPEKTHVELRNLGLAE